MGGLRLGLLLGCLALAAGQTPGEESPCSGCVHGSCSQVGCAACAARPERAPPLTSVAAQDLNSITYSCVCQAGWTGAACNTSQAAAPAPTTSACGACVHGTCAQGFNTQSYVCQCQAGWSGAACTVGAAPAQAPAAATVVGSSSSCSPGCANGGLCQLWSNGSSTCNCDGTGYSGPTCSQSGAPRPAAAGRARRGG